MSYTRTNARSAAYRLAAGASTNALQRVYIIRNNRGLSKVSQGLTNSRRGNFQSWRNTRNNSKNRVPSNPNAWAEVIPRNSQSPDWWGRQICINSVVSLQTRLSGSNPIPKPIEKPYKEWYLLSQGVVLEMGDFFEVFFASAYATIERQVSQLTRQQWR